MFKKMKVKSAAKRVQKTSKRPVAKKTNRRSTSKRTSFWTRVWNVICWPFRKIAELCRRFWNWLCRVDFIAMLNLALLVAIIVLFGLLTIDVINCAKKPVVVIAEPVPVTAPVENARNVKPRAAQTLPIKKDAQTNKFVAEPVNVVPVRKNPVAIKQIAKQDKKFYGDVIIDSRGAASVLHSNAEVNGNLYLQNMRKYTLPCGIRIDGNLFLRDVNMLQFCGDFIITGNIYVSPRSSFGPIPKTARLGGQVIL